MQFTEYTVATSPGEAQAIRLSQLGLSPDLVLPAGARRRTYTIVKEIFS